MPTTSSPHLLRWLGVLLVGSVLAGLWWREPNRKPTFETVSGPLVQEMYVWQRVWTPAVASGVREAQDRVAGFSVLAGEVTWKGSVPLLVQPKLDLALLASQKRPPGLALRIGPYAGPFTKDDAVLLGLLAHLQTCLATARAGHWEPSELQIDFDAATSKLPGYRVWLAEFQKAAAPLTLSFTALPDWLNSPAFQAMVRQTGAFVLQVHGIERPKDAQPLPTLLQAATVRRWVAQAAALHVPFRVALPTYRTTVGFNPEGKITGLDSEGPGRAWPQDTRLVTYLSPATEIAGLVESWTRERPQMLQGLLWYRLPVAGEQRNWTWDTLAPVMAGRAPLQKLSVTQTADNPIDFSLENLGEAEMPWPAEIRVLLPASNPNSNSNSSPPPAGDALTGYSLEITATSAIFRRIPKFSNEILAPRHKKPLGWLRMNAPPSTSTDYAPPLTIQIY